MASPTFTNKYPNIYDMKHYQLDVQKILQLKMASYHLLGRINQKYQSGIFISCYTMGVGLVSVRA